MPKIKFINVVVANRDRRGDPIELAAGKEMASVAPGKTAAVILTVAQFEALRAEQRKAVAREPGILRLVDFWTEVDGERVEYAG